MKWVKAALIGALGSLIMFILMMIGIHGTGIAPFNQPPSAAFLQVLGLKVGPLPLVLHFLYGMFWSIILVALFQEKANVVKGIGLALVLWLIMMVVYSPILGWGFFGIGGSGHQLDVSDPLYIGSGVKYIVATLVLHLIYGGIIGWLNPVWIHFESREQQPQQQGEEHIAST